jgi:hypothetical protein
MGLVERVQDVQRALRVAQGERRAGELDARHGAVLLGRGQVGERAEVLGASLQSPRSAAMRPARRYASGAGCEAGSRVSASR